MTDLKGHSFSLVINYSLILDTCHQSSHLKVTVGLAKSGSDNNPAELFISSSEDMNQVSKNLAYRSIEARYNTLYGSSLQCKHNQMRQRS